MNPNWTESIERDILALFVQDAGFASCVLDELKVSHFSPSHSVIYGAVRDHYRKYGSVPADSALYDSLRSVLGPTDAQFLRPTITSVYREVQDSDYVRDRVLNFINLRNLELAVRRAEEAITTGSYDEAKESIMSFSEVGPRRVINYFDEDIEIIDAEAIPTGIPELDSYLLGGGLQRGRIGVIVAGTSVGKSALMLNFGAAAVRQGYRVLHITVEDSKESVKRRYDARFAGREVNRGGLVDRDRQAIQAARMNGGDLHILSMISGRASPSAIRMAIQALGKNRPDMLIVDHIDVMRPDFRKEEKRFEHFDIATDLRGLGQEFECAVWTGKQGNRQSRMAEVVSGESAGESYGPIQVADVVLGVARPLEERRKRQLTIYLDKQRDGIAGKPIGCSEDLAKMTFRGLIRGEELEERKNARR
jgi:KaiC/GvpD/RAD55 family RecA-like ATPase